jgi:hypothetical protein
MLRHSRGASTARRSTPAVRRRVLAGLVIGVTVGGGWIASSQAAAKRSSANGDVITFHVVFSGSGNATSSYPPVATNTTVFTTSIHWNVGYDVQFTLGNVGGAGLLPVSGSTLSGVSNGVYAPGGWPIEPGCDQIDLSLDATQTAATMAGGTGPTYELDLVAPGFDGGALLAYSPSQCGNPFPGDAFGSGCPDPAGYYTPPVQLDPTKAKETWQLSEHCNIPNEGQTASWSATVTATRTSAGPGMDFIGHTRQRCSRWDSSCSQRAHLPISFEARGGMVESLFAQDEGRCNRKGLHAQDAIGGTYLPTPHPVKIGSGGIFTIKYRLNNGSYVSTIKGTVGATGSHGRLWATGRYRRTSYGYKPARRGRIICRAIGIPWTAAPAP